MFSKFLTYRCIKKKKGKFTTHAQESNRRQQTYTYTYHSSLSLRFIPPVVDGNRVRPSVHPPTRTHRRSSNSSSSSKQAPPTYSLSRLYRKRAVNCRRFFSIDLSHSLTLQTKKLIQE